MTTLVTHAARVRLPTFTPAVHAALRDADIDLFRVPRYSMQPTDTRTMLDAADGPDALRRIDRALETVGLSLHPTVDVIYPPTAMPGTPRTGDGLPE